MTEPVQTPKKQRLKIGEGRISGYISVFLAILGLGAILCFKFPERLTTPEFREVYTGESMRILVIADLIGAFFFSMLSIIISKKIKFAWQGAAIAGLAVLLGAFALQGRAVQQVSWHLGLDWLLLDLLLMTIIFTPLELFFPRNKKQTKFHEEWRTDLVYFIITHLFIQFFGTITQKPAVLFFGWMGLDGLHNWVAALPFVVGLFLAFFVTDLFQYAAHRFFHSHVYFWRFHSVHHSTQNMDWLAGSRTHFVDIFVTRAMTFIPLYVLGFSPTVFNVYIVFIAIHGVLIHANTRVNFGFLKYIFTTPQYHFWHHCEDPKFYGRNFAFLFPFIDKMFGTYYLPGNEWPAGTGVHEASYPKGIIKQSIYPFSKSPFDNDLKESEKSDR